MFDFVVADVFGRRQETILESRSAAVKEETYFGIGLKQVQRVWKVFKVVIEVYLSANHFIRR